MKNSAVPIAAAMMALASVLGVVFGMRAGAANVLFFQAKYGSARGSPDAVLRRCEAAHRLYPYSYNLCSLASDTAFRESLGAAGSDQEGYLRLSQRWCDTGLRLNRYDKRLRWRKTGLLEMGDRGEAIRFWRKHVEWEFWNPFNHHALALLHARNGDFKQAEASLGLLRGTSYYSTTLKMLNEARQAADPDGSQEEK